MNFTEFDAERIGAHVRATASFEASELEGAKQIAYKIMYRDSGIDYQENEDPAGNLVKILGEKAISSYLGAFCANYAANAMVDRLGFYPFGKPVVESILQEGPLVRMTALFRETPSYTLSSYDPIEITLPSGESGDEGAAEAIVGALMKRLVEEVSADHFSVVLHEETERFLAALESQGMSVQQYCRKNKTNEDGLRNALAEKAYKILAESMALDAVYRHQGLSYSESDVRDVLSMVNPDTPQAVLAQMGEANLGYMVRQSAERQCARRWLMSTAVISAASPWKMNGALEEIKRSVELAKERG